MFRLIIDIEMGEDQEEAIADSHDILRMIKNTLGHEANDPPVGLSQYRLTKDGSYNKNNYLNIIDGRAMNAKLKL